MVMMMMVVVVVVGDDEMMIMIVAIMILMMLQCFPEKHKSYQLRHHVALTTGVFLFTCTGR
jgi:hypothetical protein